MILAYIAFNVKVLGYRKNTLPFRKKNAARLKYWRKIKKNKILTRKVKIT